MKQVQVQECGYCGKKRAKTCEMKISEVTVGKIVKVQEYKSDYSRQMLIVKLENKGGKVV